MQPEPSVGSSLGDAMSWGVWFLGDIFFTWIPGAVVAVSGIGDPAVVGPAPQVQPITHPVTTIEVAEYIQSASPAEAWAGLYQAWSTYVAFAIFFTLCFSALIIYCAVRIRQIRHQERLEFIATAHPVMVHDVPKTQMRWNRILEQGHSDSEQNWRLAILEADIMLNELLDARGYKGETMGEKMRAVERADFNTIDLAWEAHRVRNRVAHEGVAHLLNAREVRRVLGLYERVFREFHVID